MTSRFVARDRRSIRLPYYDYRLGGAYFVTICTTQRRALFAKIEGDSVSLNRHGRIVAEEWLRGPETRSNVVLDEFIVMPNHFHAIVVLQTSIGSQRPAPLHPFIPLARRVLPGSLGAVVRAFKSASAKRINEERQTPGTPVWQLNYYERILRSHELDRAREYVRYNPLKWADDPNNPSRPSGTHR